MDNVIDLGRLWLIVRRNITLMVIMGSVVGVISFGISKFVIPAKYNASVALLVNRKQDDNAALQFQDQQADVQIINTYKDIITRPIILKAVVKNLTEPHKVKVKDAVDAKFKTLADGTEVQVRPAQPAEYRIEQAKYDKKKLNVDSLVKEISISNQTNSQVFSVNVKTNNAMQSRDIANEIAKVFKQKVATIMSVSNVSIVSTAMKESKPSSPNVKLLTLLGVVLGVLLGFIWGLIRELNDRTVKSIEYLTDELQLTNLGVISYISKMRDLNDAISDRKTSENDDQLIESRLTRRI